MTNAHTPGPWVLAIHKDGGNWDYNIRTAAPHNPAGTVGKHVATANKYLRETEANAALIAAAPDLLAALRAMIEYYDYDLSESGIAAAPAKAARDIIAKAEGRS